MRLRVGEVLEPVTFQTLAHGVVRVPDEKWFSHLQFRRFAGCPVCNLHMRRFAGGKSRLDAANIKTIALFHSPAEVMRPYQGDLPFPVVSDPERVWYRRFAVERSALAVAHPRVVLSALVGLATAPSNPFAGGSEQGGLPADFLVDSLGRIIALHYGAHADDQWSVEEVIELVSSTKPTDVE